MNQKHEQISRAIAEVQEDIQRQPHLFMRLAENALMVAESFRGGYLNNTSKFVAKLRDSLKRSSQQNTESILTIHKITNAVWSEFANEVVTFIDGGIGRVQISSQMPILLRVGSYCVRTGERDLSQREQFAYYPVILGDLEGGSKERKDFPDIVRITAELLGGLAALERTPDLRVLLFHGPLVNMMAGYAGHSPFTEHDIDIFLHHYAPSEATARQLKENFLREAKLDIYSRMTKRSSELVQRRLFEPLSWISFLFRRLIHLASTRNPIPVVAGIVERHSASREFIRNYLLKRVFRRLKENDQENYFNELFGRTDLNDEDAFLNRFNFDDQLLLAMLLKPGTYSESWEMAKYSHLSRANVFLPGESFETPMDFSTLQPNPFGFPRVEGCYVQVSDNTEPIRIEVFPELGGEQITEAARRVYLYSRLLPGYGFPVGLDIADKYAKVPNWLTNAYGKLIKHHLGVSLQLGEIKDEEMQRLLIKAMYITKRDFLFRPQS
jgi:hypothetical protein